MSEKTSSDQKKIALCPLCGQPRVKKWRPFCSPRCRDVDLFRWLNGGYIIPGQPESPSSGHHDQSSEDLAYDEKIADSIDAINKSYS